MKKFTSIFILIFLAASLAYSGVIRTTKNSITFKGMGKMTVVTSTSIDGNKNIHHSKKKFEGEGFMGGLMAKTFLRSGHTAQVISLDDQTMMDVNHNKQTFRIFPLKQVDWEDLGTEEEIDDDTEMEEEEQESNIRIIKNEFKVTKTGKSKKINKYPSEQYLISWVMVWEDMDTGERGTDSLLTNVWTTELSSEMKKAQQEEMDFNIRYAKKVGIDVDERYTEMLGLKWMAMFRAMNQTSGSDYSENAEQWTKELEKIKGYPVLTAGKYFLIRKSADEEQEQEEVSEEKPDFRNPNKALGSLMKNAFGKKKSSSKKTAKVKPAFTYRTELIELASKKVDPVVFNAPEGYTDNSEK